MRTYILSFTRLALNRKSPGKGKTPNQVQSSPAKFFSLLSALLFMSLYFTAQAGSGKSYLVRPDNSAPSSDLAVFIQVDVTNAPCTDSGSISITPTGSWATYSMSDTGAKAATIANGGLNQSQPVVVTVAAGTYVLSFTDSTDRTVNQTIVVTGAPYGIPVSDFQITTGSSLVAVNEAKAGDRVNVTATVGGPASYYWNFGNGDNDSDGVAATSYKAAGTYVIGLTVVNPLGCTATSQQTITIDDAESATGISAVSGTSGPAIWSANNMVYVDFRNVADMDATVNIYDVTGKQLSSERSGQLLYQKQIDNISEGYFIVDVNNHDTRTTQKVFIASNR